MSKKQNAIHLLLQILAMLAALASGLMACDAQVHPLLGLSPQLSLWWPVVLAGAATVGKFANALSSVFVLIWPDVPPVATSVDWDKFAKDSATTADPKPAPKTLFGGK